MGHPALSPVPSPSPAETFATQPVGNGPYRLVGSLIPGSPIHLQSHLGYYGVPPLVAALEYRSFDTPEDAWPEFLSTELDLAEIPVDVLPDATSRFGSQGIAPVARVLYCAFNQADERFSDPRLRTAVSLALDRQGLSEDVYARLPEPATALLPPTIPGHAPAACGDRCRPDPDRATSLVRAIPRRSRSFALDYAASSAGDRLAAEMTAQLGEVGLRVTPRPHDVRAYEALLRDGAHEMFCLVWVADYPRQQAFLEPLLAADSVDNHAAVEDPGIEELLEAARAKLNASQREHLYAQVERRALEEMHVIPLVWFRSHIAVQPHVQGFALDPLGRYDAADLSLT
jgi:ABC-type oligopeptide transport system substrate-binding subunit